MANKPTYGPAKLPLFSASGVPMHLDDTGTPACNCCDTLIDCQSVVQCLMRRKALLNLSLIGDFSDTPPPGHDPLECVGDGSGGYLFEPFRIDQVCDEGFGKWAWQNPVIRSYSALQCLYEFDPAFCSIGVCGTGIGAHCEDGLVYISWGVKYVLCPGCGVPDSSFYFPCEDGESCFCDERAMQTIMVSEGMPWEDLKALLLTDSVIEFELSHDPPADPGRIPKLSGASSATVKFFAPPPCDGVCSTTPPSIILFELEQIVGCRYMLTYELAEGDPSCPIQLAYLWWKDEEDNANSFIIDLPTEPIGTDWPNVMEVELGTGCGSRGGGSETVKLFIMDKCGCTSEDVEPFGCCSCEDASGNACPGGCDPECDGDDGGDIVVTQPACNEVHFEVTQPTCGIYLICEGDAAQANESGSPAGCGCGDGSWPECLTPGDCRTSTHTRELCGTKKYMAAWGEAPCGCFTPWFDLGEFTCDPCECCNGCPESRRVTISGVVASTTAQHPTPCGCTNCEGYNVSQIVPATTSCGGTYFPYEQFDPNCVDCPEFEFLDVGGIWEIWCEETEPGVTEYYLEVGMAGSYYVFGTFSISLGTIKPDCDAVSGCHTFNFGYDVTCNWSSVEICVGDP